MHLISQLDQTIQVGGQNFEFKKGETIHTENSYKYSIEEFSELAQKSGFAPFKAWTDADNLFSIHYMSAV
jgi:uncharacterized SAM-dependent methyltransferase